MAWTPITGTFIQYSEDNVDASGFYLKFYASGTTTPISMATDSTGATLLDKCQLDSDGMPINGSGGALIPHIEEKYKLLIYRNAADADANTFANAYKEIDQIDQVLTSVEPGVRVFATVALAKAATLIVGQAVETLGYYTSGDGGGNYITEALGTPDGFGDHATDDGNFQLTLQVGATVVASHYGLTGDGSTDDTLALHAFVAAYSDTVIELDSSKTYRFIGVTLAKNNTLNCNFATVIPFDDTADLFSVNEGSRVQDVNIDISAMTWTRNAVVYKPTARVRGAQHKHWFSNVTIEMQDVSASTTTGNAVYYDAATYAIQETTAENLNVYWGNKAVHMVAGATEWCNGNIIQNLVVHDAVYAIDEGDITQAVQGNQYQSVMIEANASNGNTIQLNTRSLLTGSLWDRPPIVFKGDENLIIAYPGLVNDVLVDEGVNNSIKGSGVTAYEGKRSILHFDDYRNNLSALRGRGAYRDDFMSGVLGNESSVVSIGAGTTAFQAVSWGGGSKKLTGMRCILTTDANTNDSKDLRWSDTALRTGHDPMYHFTGYLGETADTTYQLGFYTDANNYIMYETNLGAGTITPKVANGGVVTTGTPVAVTFGQAFWVSIIATDAKVVFSVGHKSISSNNMGDGTFNLSNEETITTNIPTGSYLQPRNYVRTDTTATKQLSILDVQVSWCYGFLV